MLHSKKLEMVCHQKVWVGLQQRLVFRKDSDKRLHERLVVCAQVELELHLDLLA
jgi:hypothetical protein